MKQVNIFKCSRIQGFCFIQIYVCIVYFVKEYSGRLCDLKVNPDGEHWRWLATNAEGMMARAAHTAIYLEEHDSLYVFGGYDLNNIISSLQVSTIYATFINWIFHSLSISNIQGLSFQREPLG